MTLCQEDVYNFLMLINICHSKYLNVSFIDLKHLETLYYQFNLKIKIIF
ncbi:MAG: hypothetical protein BAJALOKI2v1_1100007 [Promethearchaeota archaeon]|nr:MAG: hypothetical protein BAJALOKI2v1_1100007 [Candidatus Lokiarchaeota archaeon]